MKTFLASYNYEGGRWSLEIKARDYDDAQARLAMLSWATLDGELITRIPVNPLKALFNWLLKPSAP